MRERLGGEKGCGRPTGGRNGRRQRRRTWEPKATKPARHPKATAEKKCARVYEGDTALPCPPHRRRDRLRRGESEKGKWGPLSVRGRGIGAPPEDTTSVVQALGAWEHKRLSTYIPHGSAERLDQTTMVDERQRRHRPKSTGARMRRGNLYALADK